MFTGIIEEIGKILNIQNGSNFKTISVLVEKISKDIKIGDSIAINGVCTTITKFDKASFTVDLSSQTLNVTTLKKLKNSDFVNLERAVKVGERLGGHIVSGHVDFCAKYVNQKKDGESLFLSFEIPKEKSKYLIEKGSVTIDGISLTIAEKRDNIITVCIIPHTIENTTLKYLNLGDVVNIETDLIGKYVENFVNSNDNKNRVSENFLRENGFL